jgi:hypothetical protein
VFLPIFEPLVASQKHGSLAECQNRSWLPRV